MSVHEATATGLQIRRAVQNAYQESQKYVTHLIRGGTCSGMDLLLLKDQLANLEKLTISVIDAAEIMEIAIRDAGGPPQ